MPADTPAPLTVTRHDLDPTELVYVDCDVTEAAGNFSTAIRAGFDLIKAWARQQGFDPRVALVIGPPHVSDGQLTGYQCGLAFPDRAPAAGGPVKSQRLPGGRYAVLSLPKDSPRIGPAIGAFYRDYVPQHGLRLADDRPVYELYTWRTLEYHVPIHE